MIHLFVNDGKRYADNVRRCAYVTSAGAEPCAMPEPNRVHHVPDTTREQQEHRRRAGDGREMEDE